MQHHEMFRHRVPFFLETFRKNRPMTTANPTPDNPVYMRKSNMLCAAFRYISL